MTTATVAQMKCIVNVSDAVEKNGQYYCYDVCVDGHPDGAGCSHNGCECHA